MRAASARLGANASVSNYLVVVVLVFGVLALDGRKLHTMNYDALGRRTLSGVWVF